MDAPACWATGEPRSIGEDVRRGVYKHGVPGYRGLGDVVLGSLPRGETLDITKYADGLGPGFRPGGVNHRDVTEADCKEARRGGCSLRTGLETPALQGSKSAKIRCHEEKTMGRQLPQLFSNLRLFTAR